MRVGVSVGVNVGVNVGVFVGVFVAVGVLVGVFVDVAVFVLVGVFVGALQISTHRGGGGGGVSRSVCGADLYLCACRYALFLRGKEIGKDSMVHQTLLNPATESERHHAVELSEVRKSLDW